MGKNKMLKKWLPTFLGLSGLAVLGRLSGFIRDAIMAAEFGVSDATDAYLTSYIVMDILIAANAAVLAGTLSYFGQDKERGMIGRESLKKFSVNLFLVIAIVIAAVIVITYLFLDNVNPSTDGYLHVFNNSIVILFAASPFLIVSGVYSAVHQINGGMVFPAKLNIFMNVIAIIAIFVLKESAGIIAIPIGLLIGIILFHFYQVFHPNLRRALEKGKSNVTIAATIWGGIVIMIFLNSFLANVVGFIERYFSLSLDKGTFSYYSYAARLFLLPLSFLGYAISTSLLPFQVKANSEKDQEGFNEALSKGLIGGVLAAGFCFFIFYALSDEIVRLVYQRGEIGIEDGKKIGVLLLILSGGVFPYLITPVIANTYYALGLTKYMLINGVITIIAQTGLIIFFSEYFSDGRVLAMASATVSWISFANLVFFLNRKKVVKIDKKLVEKFLLLVSMVVALSLVLKRSVDVLKGGIEFSDWGNFIYVGSLGFLIVIIYSTAVSIVFRKKPRELIKLFTDKKRTQND
jgi:putative peptidoglycan lipid II flippase